MFARFIIQELDQDSGRRQGIFQAIADLLKSGELDRHEEERVLQLREWFNRHLEKPERLSWSAAPNKKNQALSWFKSSAKDHIGNIREYQRMLENHGISVEMIKSARPGYIVYEDEFQVAAYPFSETST